MPPVVTRLCTEHVLVTEWVDGVGFEEVKTMEPETRDRFGEIVFRFFFGSLYRTGHFSGDPHPGNYRLMPDGRVAFIDFGMTKRVDRAHIEAEVEALRLGMEGDAVGLHAQLASMGFFDVEDEALDPDAVLAHFRDVTSWYVDDVEVTIDRTVVAQVLIDFGDPRSPHWELMKRETMPPSAMLARRMEALTLGVLGQLGATANWHRIAREWLFGDTAVHGAGRAGGRFPHAAGGLMARPSAGSRTTPVPEEAEALRHLSAADPLLAGLIERYGDPDAVRARRGRRPGDAYGALIRAIVGQQISTKAAQVDIRSPGGALRRAHPHPARAPGPRSRGASRRRASRAPRSRSCATWPSTWRTGSCGWTSSPRCPTRRWPPS